MVKKIRGPEKTGRNSNSYSSEAGSEEGRGGLLGEWTGLSV